MSANTIILYTVIIFIFVFTGYLEYRRLYTKAPNLQLEKALKKAPYLYILIPLILIFFLGPLLLTYRPFIAWNLPLWLQFYFNILIWGGIISIFAFVFSLASFISFRSSHPEKWKIAIAGVLLTSVVLITQKQYTRLVAPDLMELFGGGGVILQSSGVSCAAASGANALKSFGIKKTEKEMAKLFGTTDLGTSAAQIIYGMRKIGFGAKRVQILDSDHEKLTPPAMIIVDHPLAGPESHMVTYMGVHDGKAEIWDPLHGKSFLDRKKLSEIWHGLGIEIQPPG